MAGRIAFGEFVLNVDARELLRGGTPVALSPKAFHLLAILVEHRPNALSKSDLQERLWPGTFVVEKNLTNLVAEIREALGDAASEPRFVRTIHGFGYAFHAPEQTGAGSGAAVRSPARFRLVWPGAQAPLHEGQHVIGRDPDLDVFLDSPGVSRHHARITVVGDEVTVEDLGSKNGTYVGGARVEAPVRLASGDVIRLGEVSLTLRAVKAADSTETRRM